MRREQNAISIRLTESMVARMSGVEASFFARTRVANRGKGGLGLVAFGQWKPLNLWVLAGEVKLGARFSSMYFSQWMVRVR